MRRLCVFLVTVIVLVGCGRPLGQLTVRGPTVRTVSQHRPVLTRAERAALHRWLVHVELARWFAAIPVAGMQLDGYPRAWHPCGGGTYPPCWRVGTESATAGLYAAFNPSGCSGRGCYGKWQYDPLTWDGEARRMGRPDLVGRYYGITNRDQDAVAAFTWDHGNGCSHWAACGR